MLAKMKNEYSISFKAHGASEEECSQERSFIRISRGQKECSRCQRGFLKNRKKSASEIGKKCTGDAQSHPRRVRAPSL